MAWRGWRRKNLIGWKGYLKSEGPNGYTNGYKPFAELSLSVDYDHKVVQGYH